MGGVTLIIPTLDEEESIAAVLAEVPRPPVTRVIVADGGSADRTASIAAAAGADVLAVGRGYGQACRVAAEAAGHGEVLVFMDGDGADDPGAIDRLLRPLQEGRADFVIGSRTRGRAARGSLGLHQRLAGRAFGSAVRIVCGVGYTDMCAFRAIRREDLLALGMRERTYGWNLEMQMRAARSGLRVLEVQVDNRARIGGTSKVAGTIRGSVRAGCRIVGTFMRVALSVDPRRRPLEAR